MDGSKRGEAREYWKEAVRLWGESGLSVREFCGREGLAEHSFYSWRRKLRPERRAAEVNREAIAAAGGNVIVAGRRRRRRERIADSAGDEASAVQFMPVRVLGREVSPARPRATETAEPSPIEIMLDGGRRLRVWPGFDRPTLMDVLAVLEGRGC